MIRQMLKFFHPFENFHGAIDGRSFFIACDQKRDTAFELRVLTHIIKRCGSEGRDGTFHISGPSSIDLAIVNFGRERWIGPACFIAHWHHIGVTSKTQMRARCSDAREEIINVRCILILEHQTMRCETAACQKIFNNTQRPVILRRD